MNEIKSFLKSREKVNLLLVLINILIFVILEIKGNTEDAEFMLQNGASYAPYIVEEGKYYLLVTSMFLHFGIEHLAYNMLCLILMGDMLEKEVGKIRYLFIYFVSGIAGNILSVFLNMKSGEYYVSAGASGAAYAIIGALFWLVIKSKGQATGISVKQMALLVVLYIAESVTSEGVDAGAHIGGLVVGFLLCALLTLSSGRKAKVYDGSM